MRWCFCAGGGKSERVKRAIFFINSPSTASISIRAATGFLIHHNLLLTNHSNLPSAAACEESDISLHQIFHYKFCSRSYNSDTVLANSASQGQQPDYLRTCCNPSLDFGTAVYLLGHADKKELAVGEGKIVVATHNLIKIYTDGVQYCPGSAGFDVQGNLAFMVCEPMKLASSPAAKSTVSSSSSQSWKREFSMQFGIPVPTIYDWLHHHWEGRLDDISKPKLAFIRLMSTGQKSEHSCASFILRQAFEKTEGNDEIPSSSQIVLGSWHQFGSGRSANETTSQQKKQPADSHEQGILTPQIYESPKLTSDPVQKKDYSPTKLLDMNFSHRIPRSITLLLRPKQLLLMPEENNVVESKCGNYSNEDICAVKPEIDNEALLTGSCEGDCCREVLSSSSLLKVLDLRNEGDGLSSGEETMYSAETMESRNFPSPGENNFQQVLRSQSCVDYNRWTSPRRNSAAQMGDKQHSLVPPRKPFSKAAMLPQRSHDYFSPTVSSSMKKRNSEQPTSTRKNTIQNVVR